MMMCDFQDGVSKSVTAAIWLSLGTLGSFELRVGNLRLPRFGEAQTSHMERSGVAVEGDTAGGPKPAPRGSNTSHHLQLHGRFKPELSSWAVPKFLTHRKKQER